MGKVTPIGKAGPFRLTTRADTGSFVIVGTFNGRRHRINAGYDLRLARQQLADVLFEAQSGWREKVIAGGEDWQRVATRITGRHKSAAAYRKIPFQIVPSDVFALMKAGDFHCPLSGIPFSNLPPPKNDQLGISNPWAPSIDRIDNHQGYVRDNIRVVCVAANMGMNAWGYDTLLRLAIGIVKNSRAAAIPEILTRTGHPVSGADGK